MSEVVVPKYVILPDNATSDEMEHAISNVMDKCFPFTVRLRRTCNPLDKWPTQCIARAIGLCWNNQKATIYCEYPIGSGHVYTVGALSTMFIDIYNQEMNTYNKKPTAPNGWKTLSANKENGHDIWTTMESFLPQDIRTKVNFIFFNNLFFLTYLFVRKKKSEESTNG